MCILKDKSVESKRGKPVKEGDQGRYGRKIRKHMDPKGVGSIMLTGIR